MAETFFYKRNDGFIFACEAKEAEVIHTKYQQIGVSDGSKYQYEVDKARSENSELLLAIREFETEIEAAGEDIEARMIIRKKLNGLKKQWQGIMKKASQEGFRQELESATGHFKVPTDTSRSELLGGTSSLQEQWIGTKK